MTTSGTVHDLTAIRRRIGKPGEISVSGRHHNTLCSISVNALTKVLGFRVEREEKFQNGDGRCVFRVYAEEPVDPATTPFRLESEM